MEQLDFLYPVSLALDVMALAAVILTPILGIVSLSRYGWRQARFTIAYLGYICCAVLAASFAMHLFLDGGVIYMMFVFWLVPFAIAATVALLTTLAIGRNGTLWMLALATIVLGVVQVFAELWPGGIGGGMAILVLVVYSAYAVLALAACAYHHGQWRRGWDSNPRGP